MSINAGCGWTKSNEKDDSTYISGFLSEDIKSLFPNLSKYSFVLRYIKEGNRKSEKSPHWLMDFYIPLETNEQTKSEPGIPQDIIPKEKVPF